MRFGPVPLEHAKGAILAHSVTLPDGKLRKGRRLSRADLDRMASAGLEEVTVARLDPGDVHEDEAAARVAAALAPDAAALGLSLTRPFTGRVNLHAEGLGLVAVDCGVIDAVNAFDPAVTVATVGNLTRVAARQMVATVKIIPYAAPAAAVEQAERLTAAGPAITLHPVRLRSASLVLTRTPGMAEKLVQKGSAAVRQRLAALGLALADEQVVAHETDALAGALAQARGEMTLILTGSATSDRGDVGPAAVEAAGGSIERFGMPVDPGNLLFLGAFAGRPVIGLPGCARSPMLNGADWVLERVACGVPVGSGAIAAMGVGGLLKEIPSRPAPRVGRPSPALRPRVAAVLLAAGGSTRMGGADKLLEEAGGQPLLARVAETVAASSVEEVVVVLRPGDSTRAAALSGHRVRIIENPRADEGMGTSIAAGVAALSPGADAAAIVMGDMPDLTPEDLDRLIAAFDAEEGREIVRATTAEGRPGHPVLFGRRFFEDLRALQGDSGARTLLGGHADFLVEVPLGGQAALTDLDTPEDWARWRASGAAAG